MQRSRILMIALATIAFSAVGLASDDGNFAVRYLLPGGTANISNTGLSWGAVLAGLAAPTVSTSGCPSVQNGIVTPCPTGPTAPPSITTSPGVVLGNGNLCINVFVFSADEQEQACCSFVASPNSLWSYTFEELTSNTLTHQPLSGTNSIVVKLVATGVPANSTTTCNAATAGQALSPTTGLVTSGPTAGTFSTTSGSLASALAPGVVAWARNSAALTGETAFANSNVTVSELKRATLLCSQIQQNGSGSGVCPQPKLGAR
jgi:hypothetical protein